MLVKASRSMYSNVLFFLAFDLATQLALTNGIVAENKCLAWLSLPCGRFWWLPREKKKCTFPGKALTHLHGVEPESFQRKFLSFKEEGLTITAQYNFKISRDQWLKCTCHSSPFLSGSVYCSDLVPFDIIVELVFLLPRSTDQEWLHLDLM